ncbi:DNA polymerase IV [Aestuariimicrobium kwangyangense]|uniref:DNA polymerase IV n=1 Tax=Aestuariimicrobium kwangyangense TaxID=396389 RepID=UPI0003B67380|nr:DNA polymerase IV [Aestuariimicrobium kwangyangense]
MRSTASVLHLDLDAFFASVEQRDKPSLRGKPVVVGGVGVRGVVATASYEARLFGVRSAMSGAEARRRAPYAAFLSPRFEAYRQSSRIVMALLAEYSPRIEPLSLDEAFVDLAAGGVDCSSVPALVELGERIRAQVFERTEGLTASIGIGTSKFMAKVASELGKPDGLHVVAPGDEVTTIAPLPAKAIPGVGPVSAEKLNRLGIHTVADVQRASLTELTRELGSSWASGLHAFAFARDDRPVESQREVKSISVEDTFETDLTDRAALEAILDRDSEVVVGRLRRHGFFARTVTIKVRFGDFTTHTRSRSFSGGTDSPERVARAGRELLSGLDVRVGVRLLGIGVSSFVGAAQEELFDLDDDGDTVSASVSSGDTDEHVGGPFGRRRSSGWTPGMEVEHEEHGRGWVWGTGLGRVTVRFETRAAPHGRVRSFLVDDPALSRATALLPMAWQVPEDDEDSQEGDVDHQALDDVGGDAQSQMGGPGG